MDFKQKIRKFISTFIVLIMIINFIPSTIIQAFAEDNMLKIVIDFQEIGIETDLKIKVEDENGYNTLYNYNDLIDNNKSFNIPNIDCSITFINGLNTEDVSDDITICTIKDLKKYSNLKSRYKVKWMYYPSDITVDPATITNTSTTIKLVTYINGDMNIDGLLKGNDLLMLKQQLLFDYNIIQTGAYNSNLEEQLNTDDGNLTISGYNNSTHCNNVCINGDLYADNLITIKSVGGNLNGKFMSKRGSDISFTNNVNKIAYSYFNSKLLLSEDDVNQLYFDGVKPQESITYPENTSNININQNMSSDTTIDLIATNSINLNASIKAVENINISGEVHNSNNAIIYSKRNITIQNDSTFSFTGMIYAPEGKVTIKSKNVNITGTIIAKEIVIEAETVNFNVNNYIINDKNSKVLSALQVFLGDMNNNGTLDEDDLEMMQCIILGIEYVNLEDKDNNNIPDIFENEEEWKNYNDSDNDGLPDFLETYLGTDKMLLDTDNDGLTDYDEVMFLNTDPCSADTDENGINDGDEDFDGDGLTNLEELENGTSMINIDSDGDGLDDYYEINYSKTNPLIKDTDGNGIDDGDELFDQKVEVSVNDEESAINEVKVELSTQQKNYNNTSIESVMGIDIMSSNVVGLVGEPYNFTTNGDFSEATITFNINSENLENCNFEDLVILWYNQEEQRYECLDTQLNESTNEVSAITSHFSTFLVVDSVEWNGVWINDIYTDQITWDYCDTALVIDCSGSTNSVRSYEITAAQKFIQGKISNEKISIIAEDQGTTGYWGEDRNSDAKDMITVYNDMHNANYDILTDQQDDLNNVLNYMKEINFGGGNNFDSSLSMALTNLSSSSSNKVIIFLSDGICDVDESLLNNIKEEGIKIYTIGFNCNDDGRNILYKMSSTTGGRFFEINYISELDDIYNTINIEKNMIFSNPEYAVNDSDEDGILDFFEINGIKLANGQFIKLSDEYDNPHLNEDCDGDGLRDGTELTQVMKPAFWDVSINQEDELLKRRYFYFVLNSYPDNPDSDNDYYNDSIDTRKFEFDSMQIIDEKLNDDNSIDGNNPVASNTDYTDGVLQTIQIDDGECFKNEYTFTRDTNKKCEFTITPQKNSDYSVCVSDSDCEIFITSKGFWGTNISQDEIISENKSNDMVIYTLSLEKNKTYCISLYNSCSTTSQYTVNISQDNWVYAPNGAVSDCSAKGSIYTNTIFYINEETVKQIIQNYYLYKHHDILVVGDFEEKTEMEKRESCDSYAEIFIDSYIETSNDSALSAIGNGCTSAGFIALTSKTLNAIIGEAATIGSTIVMLQTEKEKYYKSKLSNAIYEGGYNITMLITSYERYDYPSYKKVYSSSVDWGSWKTGKNGYIYRYDETSTYRINTITELNHYIPEKNENDEWVLKPYED